MRVKMFGTRTKDRPLGQLVLPCKKCQRPVFHRAVALKRRFTLLFVPLIPLGTGYRVICGACGYWSYPSRALRGQLVSWNKTGKVPPGIEQGPQGDSRSATAGD